MKYIIKVILKNRLENAEWVRLMWASGELVDSINGGDSQWSNYDLYAIL